jgi:indole-3-glycerol phosphate synthase
MHSVLKRIIAQKEKEVAALKASSGFFLKPNGTIKSLAQSLAQAHSLIAEIKRASPAKGALSSIVDPAALASVYQQAGASGISVLTDNLFFNGSLDDLFLVSSALQNTSCPILRKEFIIDRIQIDQALHFGADAILLIVAVLGEKTQSFIDHAHSLGLEVLLEIHTLDELQLALKTNAKIIGINNRNLNSLEVSLETSFNLIKNIPNDIVTVSESGIHSAQTAHQLYDAGFNALLVGEALVRSDNPETLIKGMRGVKHED